MLLLFLVPYSGGCLFSRFAAVAIAVAVVAILAVVVAIVAVVAVAVTVDVDVDVAVAVVAVADDAMLFEYRLAHQAANRANTD